MGLITEEVEIRLGGKNIKHYEELGYEISKKQHSHRKNILVYDLNIPLLVKVQDLSSSSKVYVDVKCDGCGKDLNVQWKHFKDRTNIDGKYYCLKCAINLYANKNANKVKLDKGISFEKWCLDNNFQDILDRWDYELNECKPSEIGYKTGKKYYFKCLKGLHKSELKNVGNFVNGFYGALDCKKCGSFAQWGIDNLGKDFLDKYWDYEKNTIDPWNIDKCCGKRIFIKCQEKYYHNSYDITCVNFISGFRCSYCSKIGGKVHPLDSLGRLLEDKGLLHLWSDKNKESPYKYAPMSSAQQFWWKCPDGKHEDFLRVISNSNIYNFRCPECQYSKGEEKISNIFIDKEFVKIEQKEFNELIDENKCHKNFYIPQIKYDSLIGLGNGLLSYDFYIPKLNLLIEYQGEQHEKYIPGFHKSKKDFLKQQEHDKRKREYAQINNINLLEIWYWDFNNIEEILDAYFDENKKIFNIL